MVLIDYISLRIGDCLIVCEVEEIRTGDCLIVYRGGQYWKKEWVIA